MRGIPSLGSAFILRHLTLTPDSDPTGSDSTKDEI